MPAENCWSILVYKYAYETGKIWIVDSVIIKWAALRTLSKVVNASGS